MYRGAVLYYIVHFIISNWKSFASGLTEKKIEKSLQDGFAGYVLFTNQRYTLKYSLLILFR